MEQDKNTKKPLNDEEIGNSPEKEFRVIIVKMIQDLGQRMETRIENLKELLSKELVDLKSKMNRAIVEMKDKLNWFLYYVIYLTIDQELLMEQRP